MQACSMKGIQTFVYKAILAHDEKLQAKAVDEGIKGHPARISRFKRNELVQTTDAGTPTVRSFRSLKKVPHDWTPM
eukprot:4728110-Pleurochrysis_carterae.AAC.1